MFEEDMGFKTEELVDLMEDRVLWREVVRNRTKRPTSTLSLVPKLPQFTSTINFTGMLESGR